MALNYERGQRSKVKFVEVVPTITPTDVDYEDVKLANFGK